MLFGFFLVFMFFETANGTPPWAHDTNANANAYGTPTYQPKADTDIRVPCPPPVPCPKQPVTHDTTKCPIVECPTLTSCDCPMQLPRPNELPVAHGLPNLQQQSIQSPPPHAQQFEIPIPLTTAMGQVPKEPSDLTPLQPLPDSTASELQVIEAQTSTPLNQDFYEDTVHPTIPTGDDPVSTTTKPANDNTNETAHEAALTPRPKEFAETKQLAERLREHNHRLQALFATEAPFRRRYLKRFRFSKKQFGTPTLTSRDKGRCNSLKLKMIMMESIEKTPTVSKRAIQRAASAEIGGSFDVICSKHDFSYLANTRLYCETRIADIVCFAFMHEPEKETSF